MTDSRRGDTRQLIQGDADLIQELLQVSGARRVDPELWSDIAAAASDIARRASEYSDYLTSLRPQG